VTKRPYLFLAILSSVVVLLPRCAEAQAAIESGQPAPVVPSPPQASQAISPFDPTNTRILSDPLFLPVKGQVYGVTAYTLDMPKGDNFKAGVNTGSFTASDNLINQTIAFGVTNDLTIRFVEGYGVNNRDSTAAATGDVTTGSSRGFNDPTISATLRIVDEPRAPVIFDLTASYSPDLLASEASGGTGSEGTMGRGGQTAGVSFALGREMRSFTIAGTGGTTYVGQQMTELLSNSTSTQSQAYWNYSLGLTTQTRFTNRFSLDAGVAFSSAGNYVVSNLTTGNSHTYTPPSTRTLNLALNYHIVPNRVVGEFTYTYNNDTGATNTFAKATSDTAVENRMGNVVGVRLLYAFK
jgi:hypothetical protein